MSGDGGVRGLQTGVWLGTIDRYATFCLIELCYLLSSSSSTTLKHRFLFILQGRLRFPGVPVVQRLLRHPSSKIDLLYRLGGRWVIPAYTSCRL